MVRNKPGRSCSLEAQINEWGALLYSPLWLVLWEKLGKPPKELALGVVARDECARWTGESKCREMKCKKGRRDVMVACPFILPGHLLLGVVGFCDMTALLPCHEHPYMNITTRLQIKTKRISFISFKPCKVKWYVNTTVNKSEQSNWHWLQTK